MIKKDIKIKRFYGTLKNNSNLEFAADEMFLATNKI
jgi:hypothetical protein